MRSFAPGRRMIEMILLNCRYSWFCAYLVVVVGGGGRWGDIPTMCLTSEKRVK